LNGRGSWGGGGDAPLSFTSGSRGSSLMEEMEREGGGGPGIGSRVHLIERSPFDDPDDGAGDDGVSEISGPIHGRDGNGDAMSAVSDLSYQRASFDEFSRRGFS